MTPTLFCPNLNISTSGQSFYFKVASNLTTMVLDLSQPQRVVYSDAALTLKGTVISCDAQNPRALKGKHFRVSFVLMTIEIYH
jgi:hypothetical protein